METGAGAIRAINTLASIGALKSSHVLTALRHKHFGVRIHALRIAEPLLKKDKAISAHVFSMVDTLDPRPKRSTSDCAHSWCPSD